MTVAPTWIRDQYDTVIRDCRIDASENLKAIEDLFADKITTEQQQAVQAAYDNQTLLPAYENGGISFSSVPTGANITITVV